MSPLEGLLAGIGVGLAIMVVRTIYLRSRNPAPPASKQRKRAKKP